LDYTSAVVLTGGRTVPAQLLSTVNTGIFNGFVFILMLVILQRIVRNQWVAAGLFIAIWTLKAVAQGQSGFEAYFLEPLSVMILVFLLARFGLFATAVYVFMENLIQVPFTPDTSAWYAWIGWLGVGVIAAIMIYGARTALAGQSLFGRALTSED
jgi:hypothetical protein